MRNEGKFVKGDSETSELGRKGGSTKTKKKKGFAADPELAKEAVKKRWAKYYEAKQSL